jgi:hypothetical protein
MVSALERAAHRERQAVLRGDAAALDRLLRAWHVARDRIAARIEALAPDLAADPTPARIRAHGRFASLSAQIDAELRALALETYGVTTARQLGLATAAGESAKRLVEAQSPSAAARGSSENDAAVADLVGTLADGSPVAAVVDRRFGEFARTAKDELVASLAEGLNPRDVARRLSGLGDGFASRHVLTLARTESLRAYRTASLRTMAQNDDILDGWVWLADLSATTCLACLSMHGRHFDLTETWFPAHPSCRCSPQPSVKGLRLSPLESGEDWFNRQPAAAQARQMGPAAFAAWKAGDVAFGDFLGRRESATWGPAVYERSLREAMAA